jgi:hypothetical protein
MILFQVDGSYSLGSLLYLSFSIILVGKLKERKEEKKKMEKRKINPKRRKGMLFSIPSVNLK